LLAVPVQANPQGPLPNSPTSLVSVAEPNVIVTGIKRADEGGALIVRLWELTGHATTAHVRLDRHVAAVRAEACNLVEEPTKNGPLEIRDGVISVPIRGHGLAGVRVE
jgi:alpha-mannosidase